MAINKNERVLVFLSHVASGQNDFLYQFIEASGRDTVENLLGDEYDTIVKLYGANATLAKLIARLTTQGARASIKRIDLIVMLHGKTGKLVFYDGSSKSSVVKTEIKALNLESKLRLAYSTACYGDSHSKDFLSAGFDSAIGSKKVNANAAVEVAPLLALWRLNFKLSACLAPTVAPTPAADYAATLYGQANDTDWKNDVNSTKVLRGNKNLRIST